MRIDVGDIHSTVITPDFKAIGWVRRVCRARPNGYFFMPKYKKGVWDGYVSLMAGPTSFPTGLLGMVVGDLRKRGYSVEVYGLPPRNLLQAEANLLKGIALRDYQLRAVNKLLDAGRGVAKMATNSGKTEVMAALVKVLDRQSIVLVHRKELLYQTQQRFQKRLGVPVGIIGDNENKPQRITIAMIQTLANIYEQPPFREWVAGNEVLLVDECHNASSDQFMKVLSSIPGHWRYGFSGTPLKYDDLADLQLMAATGRIIVDVGNEQLIQQGYSAKPIIHVHIVEDLQEANDDMPFSEAYDRFIVHNEQRNAIIKEVASEVTGITLIIVSRVKHGTLLNKLIPGSTFVSGGHSTEHRQRVLDEMRQGTPGAYIATNIFDEGVDVPNVNTLVLAAGGKSHVRILQRVGRGLRQKTEGDNIVNIHDFIDDTNKHLIEHSEERMKVYEDEGFDFRIHESSSGTVL